MHRDEHVIPQREATGTRTTEVELYGTGETCTCLQGRSMLGVGRTYKLMHSYLREHIGHAAVLLKSAANRKHD
jgi:hypothetical protein